MTNTTTTQQSKTEFEKKLNELLAEVSASKQDFEVQSAAMLSNLHTEISKERKSIARTDGLLKRALLKAMRGLQQTARKLYSE